MERSKQIAASVRRAISLKAEALHREARETVSMAVAKGGLQSSSHVLNIEGICVDGYRNMATTAAVQIAEIEGEEAPQHADMLATILREAQADILRAFGTYATPGQIPKVMAELAKRCRADIEMKMDEILRGTVDDLRLGIAGGMNVKRRKEGIVVDNRGGAGQIIINSRNASQSVGRNQTAGGGIDPAALLAALQRVRQELDTADVPPDARDEIEDAVVNAEREIESDTPDPGRVQRLLGTVAKTAREFGVAVAAAVVSAEIQKMGG